METCRMCGKRLALRGRTVELRAMPLAGAVAAALLVMAVYPCLAPLIVFFVPFVVRAKPIVASIDTALHVDGRTIPLRAIGSIDREDNTILVIYGKERVRINAQPELHDAFVRHAIARIALAHRRGNYKSRRALEAMLVHGAQAVICSRHEVLCMAMDEALAAHPRHQKIFVRHELVGTYRTPHDPRFVAV